MLTVLSAGLLGVVRGLMGLILTHAITGRCMRDGGVMAREKYKRLLTALHSGQPRFCTVCRRTVPRAGGREVAINGGRNVRWVCGGCNGGDA